MDAGKQEASPGYLDIREYYSQDARSYPGPGEVFLTSEAVV